MSGGLPPLSGDGVPICPQSCCVGLENVCLDNLDSWRTADGVSHTTFFGILLELGILLYSFTAVAIVADEHLVTSLETLCVRWNVPEDVAGASFLAVGSAAPEIVINAIGVYKAHRVGAGGETTSAAAQREANSALQLGLSAIIGSGMLAFLLAPAICTLGAGQVLKLNRRPLAKNILFYVLSLVALCVFFKDGGAPRLALRPAPFRLTSPGSPAGACGQSWTLARRRCCW